MRNFPDEEIEDDQLQWDAKQLVKYMDSQWINKAGPPNIWNFNRLARSRNTNPAESFHSWIKRYG